MILVMMQPSLDWLVFFCIFLFLANFLMSTDWLMAVEPQGTVIQIFF